MQYKVKQGDSLALIAKNHGFSDWHLIYDDPQNADFRKKHPDPGRVSAGDTLFIPDKKPATQSKAAGDTHQFSVKKRPGVWNLKWDPAEGTFGELKSAKLTGDTDLPDGTVVTFASRDKEHADLDLPEVEAKASGKKISVEWKLAELYHELEHVHALELSTHPVGGVSGNLAELVLHNPGCVAEEIEVAKCVNVGGADKAVAGAMGHDEEESERQPNKDHVLQVVADGPLKLRIDLDKDGPAVSGGLGDFSAKPAEKEKEKPKEAAPAKKPKKKKKGKGKKLKGKRARDLHKAFKEAGHDARHLAEDFEPEASFYIAASEGGEAELEARLKLSQEACKKEHTFQLSGKKSQKLEAAGEELKLPFEKEGAAAKDFVKPTVYKLEGKGCKGEKKAVTVQVFPANTLLVGVKVAAELGGEGEGGRLALLGKVAHGLSKLLKVVGAEVEPKFEAEGTIACFAGFREEEQDWRVYFARQISAELAATMALSAKISALRALSKNTLPEELTDYLADAELSVGLSGGLRVEGKYEYKEYSPEAGGEKKPTGAIEITGKVAVPIAVRVGTGKALSKVLAAEVSGKVEPAVHLTGVLEWEPGEMIMRPKGAVDEAELEIGVQLRASFQWKYFEIDKGVEFEWKYKLWHEHEFESLKGVKCVLYSDKQDHPEA